MSPLNGSCRRIGRPTLAPGYSKGSDQLRDSYILYHVMFNFQLKIILDCTRIENAGLEKLQNIQFQCKRLAFSPDTARYRMLSMTEAADD